MSLAAKCRCQHCDQIIEFEIVHAGEVVNCPGCGMDTRLFVPPELTQPPIENEYSIPSTCTKCNSKEIKTLSAIYEQGTTTGFIGGLGGMRLGDSFIGSFKSRSILAERAKPPTAVASTLSLIIAWTSFVIASFFAFGICVNVFENQEEGLSYWALLFLAAPICLFVIAIKFQSSHRIRLKQLTLQLHRWKNTWCCISCGETFLPENRRPFGTKSGTLEDVMRISYKARK